MTKTSGLLSCIIAAAGLLMLNSCTPAQEQGQPGMAQKRIMLIGASIGKSWKLAEYAGRMNDRTRTYESIAVYQYDKSEALEEILMRPKRKFHLTLTYVKGFFQPSPMLPDVIILKECSSYFPGDAVLQKELMRKWIKRVRDAHREVMVATVVPVTRARAEAAKGKMEGIQAYNDWIREYAKQEGIKLLDLEAALRNSHTDHFLRDELNSGDGTHLNQKAYEILDKLLLQILERQAG